jgi:hypothetical protein
MLNFYLCLIDIIYYCFHLYSSHFLRYFRNYRYLHPLHLDFCFCNFSIHQRIYQSNHSNREKYSSKVNSIFLNVILFYKMFLEKYLYRVG